MQRLVDELRERNPVLAEKAKTQRRAAIRLFCLECVGGSQREVIACTTQKCPLYPFRRGTFEGVKDEG